MRENGRSKGQRLFLFGFAAVLLAFALVPFSAYAGSAFAAPFSSSSVLSAQSVTASVWTNDTHQVPFATTAKGAEFSVPANEPVYVVTNLTLEEAQGKNVNQFSLYSSDAYAGNVTWGVGTSPANFVPFVFLSVSNLTSVTIPVATQFLTGNQSYDFMVELQSDVTTYTVSFSSQGNTGLSQWFGPAVAENIGYILGGTLIFLFAFLAMPWTDLDIRWMTRQMARIRKGRGRRPKEVRP